MTARPGARVRWYIGVGLALCGGRRVNAWFRQSAEGHWVKQGCVCHDPWTEVVKAGGFTHWWG